MSANAGRVYAAVMLGSALGAVARFACSLVMLHLLGPGFPWGTLTVNGVGSFLIGLFAGLGILYAVGVVAGILIELLGVTV